MITSIPDGLSEAEVNDRKQRGLQNSVSIHAGRSYALILRQHVFTFINVVLFSIAASLVALGRADDAFATLSLVVFNVFVGVFQELRAKRELKSIELLVRPTATVVREGSERTIDPSEVVMNDIVVARSGDQIVVDGEMVSDGPAEVDESLLTGESEAVTKRAGDAVLSGSFCLNGTLVYETAKVGADSFVNRLAMQAKSDVRSKTPLQQEVDQLIRVMLLVIVALGGVVALSLFADDIPLVEAFRIAAVIVALVPQGLFFMTTVSYAMGVVRVSSQKALVQHLNAIESISHVNVLCMDKTGTLTTDAIELEGVHLVEAGVTIGDLKVREILGNYAASSSDRNRTIDAIRQACPGSEQHLHGQVAFSSAHKWSSLQWNDGTFVLGAPEVLTPFIDGSEAIENEVTDLVATGRRVLLFGRVPANSGSSKLSDSQSLHEGIEPIAVLSFSESLRGDAKETIERLINLGIEPKFISGDHPRTLQAVCRNLGFDGNLRAVSGLDIDESDDAAVDRVAADATIFGRITPSQKQALVRAFQRRGDYVAMIGDGINDVLALKQANVGVAMQSGSQATRAVADLVLLDDSFSALPRAFREGQKIVSGMTDVVRLLLVRSSYLVLTIAITQMLGFDFPVTPKHNAILALLTVGLPIVAIAAWARPSNPPASVIKASLRFVYSPAITISVVVLGIYVYYLETSNDVDVARTALTTAGLLCGLILIPFVEPPTRWWVAGDRLSGDWRPTILAFGMLLLFALVLAVPPLREFSELVVLGWLDYLGITVFVMAWAIVQRYLWRKNVLGSPMQVGDQAS